MWGRPSACSSALCCSQLHHTLLLGWVCEQSWGLQSSVPQRSATLCFTLEGMGVTRANPKLSFSFQWRSIQGPIHLFGLGIFGSTLLLRNIVLLISKWHLNLFWYQFSLPVAVSAFRFTNRIFTDLLIDLNNACRVGLMWLYCAFAKQTWAREYRSLLWIYEIGGNTNIFLSNFVKGCSFSASTCRQGTLEARMALSMFSVLSLQ